MRSIYYALTIVLATLLSGCVNQTIKSTSVPPIVNSSKVVEEALLLDVGIAIFDPNLDEYDEGQRTYPEVRKAESRFMPGLLSQAMQQSGAWGAVRVVPDPERISDLSVRGKIIHSDGESLQLAIHAVDSRGVKWLDKTYSGKTSRYAYSATTRDSYDPFQAVYHTIANDLVAAQEKLRTRDRKTIRAVTELLFAQQFSNEAFGGYLSKNSAEKISVARLPAEGDPMLQRVRTIRNRDHAYIDTMQEYYSSFGLEMIGPYQEWRKLSYAETIAYQQVKAESRRRLIAGTVAIIAGIAGAGSSDRSSNAAGNVAIISGGYLLKSGLEKRNEAQIHVEALEELGMSLEAEITPQVIELEDRTVMLSGNVEDQYAQWRELLADIYATEIGALEPPQSTATAADAL